MTTTRCNSISTDCGGVASCKDPPLPAPLSERRCHPIDRLIEEGQLESALAVVEAMPPSTPELSRLMGRLFLAMATHNRHEDLAQRLPSMLARCVPHPEITRALMALVACSPHSHVQTLFSTLEHTVARLYGVSQPALGELIRRMAYSYRRTGDREAANRLLDIWRHRPAA